MTWCNHVLRKLNHPKYPKDSICIKCGKQFEHIEPRRK